MDGPLRLRFLGTGTSFGVPVVGCRCATCTSPDPRDRRTRHAAVLEWPGHRLLIDAPPELRLQLLAAQVEAVDAVWLTHTHADHLHGLDDVRVFHRPPDDPLPVFVPRWAVDELLGRFGYIFDLEARPRPGTSRPRARLVAVDPYAPVTIGGATVLPLLVDHGGEPVLGLRIGPVGYITDAKTLPPATRAALRGVRLLVLNALWSGASHPTHLNVEEALALAQELGADVTYLTHLSHRVRHADTEAALPPSVRLAYDGLTVAVDGSVCSGTSTPTS